MRGTAELHDLDGPAPLFRDEYVAQDDHVVEHELLDAVVGHAVVLVGPLGGHDRGDPEGSQGRADPVHLMADDCAVGESAEDRAERVDGHAPGADPADRVLDARHERAEAVAADNRSFLVDSLRGIDECPLAGCFPLGDLEAERGEVAADVLSRLLEGDEDPGLAELKHPLARNSTANSVLPLPVVPPMKVARPGSPPSATWSKPLIPVGIHSIGLTSVISNLRAEGGRSERSDSLGRPRARAARRWSDRSPITRRWGGGASRNTVGVARIRCSSARSGCWTASMTSSSYPPGSRDSQSTRRFASAAWDRSVCPATYSRKVYLVMPRRGVASQPRSSRPLVARQHDPSRPARASRRCLCRPARRRCHRRKRAPPPRSSRAARRTHRTGDYQA